MAIKQSDQVRDIVLRQYVRPAVEAGSARVSIRAGDVLKRAEAIEGFPRGRTPLVCNVLQSKKLLDEAGLEIEDIEGPPSRQSRRVVVHYRVADPARSVAGLSEHSDATESPAARAHRLTEKLRGLLKDEIAAFGGTEAFIRWVRSDDEDAA
ncbi:MAG TPA: hypothetical protein VJU82_08020 [Acidobacteriaceae bacterium]|nr:hypothetical protein [Acidobacteriaceae bacterium]